MVISIAPRVCGLRASPPIWLCRVYTEVASLLKRWWLGTYHGGISEQHLDDYLNEFTFRFNRRTSRARGLLFYRLVQQAVYMDAVPFDQIRGGNPNL